jgi:hypothetical protein
LVKIAPGFAPANGRSGGRCLFRRYPETTQGRSGKSRLVPLAALLALAACSYRGDIDNPVTYKATWFSYLDGGDIRAACAEGALDRYRLVYNARYEEQLRSYEITADGGGGAYFVARAMGRANLAEVSLDDLLSPWRWQRSQTQLTPAEMRQFVSTLEASGMFAGAPVGLRLFSGDFYWVASACRNGVFYYNAWLHPSERFARLRFPPFVFTRDKTGLPVNPPRFVPVGDRLGPMGRQEDQTGTRFWLQVRQDGLGGLPNLF